MLSVRDASKTFRIDKSKLSRASEWQRLNQRKLTKSEFADMICALWNEALIEATIKYHLKAPAYSLVVEKNI